jgi:hypothetical protein
MDALTGNPVNEVKTRKQARIRHRKKMEVRRSKNCRLAQLKPLFEILVCMKIISDFQHLISCNCFVYLHGAFRDRRK